MAFLFGHRVKPEEVLRKNLNALRCTERELNRQLMVLQEEEKKIAREIKTLGRKGEIEPIKIMARNMVKTRRQIKKFNLMKTNIQGLCIEIRTMKSTNQMANAMSGVAKVSVD
ncbi:Charged multivesicular body protein 2a [Thelohanellus kitauei]|uniref:Charged multivesicular body protein 2a n=1 Tax=Thelohanellus kitauei TaxID=669202 RepID=A0A0C2MF37_THEKT|nr:Charged multivesicular body protein 2a [Thelohanellus kitauei]